MDDTLSNSATDSQMDAAKESQIRELLFIGDVSGALDLVDDIIDPTLRRELRQTVREY